MTTLRSEEQRANWSELEHLAKDGPVIVTRKGRPLLVVQEATTEWLEAWAAETDIPGDMPLEEYIKLYGLEIDPDQYRQEFPEDAVHTYSPESPSS